eukprot:CAMPEP_0201590666 /NCGR_PEP_ID=MMETSP0190_2-20130828/180542_1 /ASSEMBLY_ACC=CAM_ASM_000263 /TAXON_ID=37353 /ORGANISM="Rosalina sp." /LENGTH=413 /DNA_ID=CAMNT_0048047309 /DNA_START=14 /DNA_END=1255 /DNA_ORIENTATION=-
MAINVDLKSLKISLIIIIFCSGVFGVLSPRLFKPFGSRLSYASLLSSGVLLAAALVHLLGDAADGLESAPLPKTADGDPFPWAYLFCGGSFYFLYFFERFVLHALAHHDHDEDQKSKENPASLIGADDNNTNPTDDSLLSQISGPPVPVTQSTEHKPLISNLPSPAPIRIDTPPNMRPVAAPASNHGSLNTGPNSPLIQSPSTNLELDEHGAELFELLVQKNYLTGIVLLIGLGLHSFLAGVALGSSEQENQAVALGIAIISHKYLAAFALGVPLYKSKMKLIISVGTAILFGCLTPLGIGLGWVLAKSFDGWVGDMFVSIASGTFIYVSICEVLIPEFSQQKKEEKITFRVEESRRELSRSNTSILIQQQRLKAIKDEMKLEEKRKAKRTEIFKSLAVVTGFILMSMLAFWV